MKNIYKRIIVFLLIITTSLVQAQTSFEDDVQDVPVSPNYFIILLGIIAFAIGVYYSLNASKKKSL